MSVLAQYVPVRQGEWHGWVWREHAAELTPILLDQACCTPRPAAGGRGSVFSFTVAGIRGVLRKFRRGGMMRHCMPDHYLFDNRPLKEFSLTAELHAAGLPVPQPLGVCWRRRYGWFDGWIATQELDAVDFVTRIRENKASLPETLQRVGQAICHMHDSGVYHADLNARNILVSDTCVYLIDFDRGRRLTAMSSTRRAANLLRLRRSLRKMGAEAMYESVASGYGPLRVPAWMESLYAIKCLASKPAQIHACEKNEHA